MLVERIEGKWIAAFVEVFGFCKVRAGDVVAILSETQSRPVNVQLAELALSQIGARVFHVVLPSRRLTAPVPVRSTGASDAVGGLEPVIAALAGASLVVDCTVEGMLHAPELPRILGNGSRLFMISNEHPETLERMLPDPALEPKVKLAIRMLKEARQMRVTSPHGTDLVVDMTGASVGGVWGWVDRPGKVGHWPGGLCLAYPRAGAATGRVVLAPGDLNLTFKRYLESPVELLIDQDYIVDIRGAGVDADLTRAYLEAWNDRNAYAISHVGWGMNPRARWEGLIGYDKRDTNAVEQRAFAGNFLFSTGANEAANRYTLGHFDLPMRNCTVELDGFSAVKHGQLQGELA
jgi:2,5-dihydroxypyridine 5,6-dioxygenase